MSAFKGWRVLAPVALLLGVSAAGALAQAPLKAWPDQQQPQQQQPRAWPGEAPAQQASAPPAAAPMAPMSAPPPMMMAPPQGMGGGGGMMGGGMGGPPPNAGAQQACAQEFTRLRTEVEAKGKVAKAVQDKKGSREEMCAALTGIHNAHANWLKWAKANTSKCGIPPDITKQLAAGTANLAKVRKGVCSGGAAVGQAAAPAAPSLSEALGTARMPTTSTSDNTERKRGGVLDTMTGTAIR